LNALAERVFGRPSMLLTIWALLLLPSVVLLRTGSARVAASSRFPAPIRGGV
jgi:hypothetical protein